MTQNQDTRDAIRLREPLHIERVSDRFLATLVELGGDDVLVATVKSSPRGNPFLRAVFAWRRVMRAIGKEPWRDVFRAVIGAISTTIRIVLPARDRHR